MEIYRIFNELSTELGDSFLQDKLSLTKNELNALKKDLNSIKLNKFISVSNECNFSIEKAIGNSRIDKDLILSKLLGAGQIMPERYNQNATSKLKLSSGILKLTKYDKILLKELQMTRDTFENHEAKVSTKLSHDMIHYLSRRGIDPIELGKQNILALQNFLSQKRSMCLVEALEFLEYEIACTFEKSNRYWVHKLNSDVFILRREMIPGSLSPEEIEEQKTTTFNPVCLYRLGFVCAFPYPWSGEMIQLAHETKCIHRGDPYCEYVFDLTSATASTKQLFSHPCH